MPPLMPRNSPRSAMTHLASRAVRHVRWPDNRLIGSGPFSLAAENTKRPAKAGRASRRSFGSANLAALDLAGGARTRLDACVRSADHHLASREVAAAILLGLADPLDEVSLPGPEARARGVAGRGGVRVVIVPVEERAAPVGLGVELQE